MPSDDLTQEQLAFATLRDIAATLHKAAEEILAKRDDFLAAARALQKAKLASVPVFKQAEQAYRGYAEAEKYQAISDDYVLLADTFRAFSDKLERQAKEDAPDEEAWSSTLDYIARTAIFLQRLERTLSILEPLDSAAQRAQYSEKLRTYIEYYERLRKSLKDLHDTFISEAMATDLRPAPAVEKPKSPARYASLSRSEQLHRFLSLPVDEEKRPSTFATITTFPVDKGRITLPWFTTLIIGQQLPMYDLAGTRVGTVKVVDRPYGLNDYHLVSVTGSAIRTGYRVGILPPSPPASQIAMARPVR
jgi:hypothetical protein